MFIVTEHAALNLYITCMQWHTTVKQYNFFCIHGIVDVKMSNERGDLPNPLSIIYPNSKRNEIFPIS